MKLLVTGGCGFIGSNFIQYQFDTYTDVTIVNLDKLTYAGNPMNLTSVQGKYADKYTFVQGDIGDPELADQLFEEHNFDAVVNFAAESHVDRSINDPSPFVTTNVAGAQSLLHRAYAHKVERFLHISTDEVYGTLGPDGKFMETTPLAPNSPYSASKAGADMMCRAYFETYGYDVVITRCSNNYGPYQFPEKLIPLMIGRAEADENLPVYGNGSNIRDWIHVLDHCRGVDLALRKGKPGGIYNLGGDAERDNLTVVKTILSLLNKPESLITFVTDRPGHDQRYAMDFTLANKELGFSPDVTFEQGIRQTLTWYQENRDWTAAVQSGEYRTFMDSWYGERL